MTYIDIKIDSKYREALDLLKQVIPNSKGKEITEDSEMVEALIDSFLAFIQEEAWDNENIQKEQSEESCDWWSCGCSH